MAFGLYKSASIDTAALAANAVTSVKITDGAIATADLAADAVTGAKLADESVDSEHFVDGSIDTAHLAADAVTGAKLADESVDSEHFVDGSIDTAHLAADAVTSAKLADDSVDSEHLVDASVDNAHLAGGIANAKLANSSVTVSDGSNTSPIALGGTLTFAGTANEVDVAESAGTITVGLPDNVTIAGNLTVSGTTTTINSTVVSVADPVFELGSSASDDNKDRGLVMKWHNGTSAKKAFMGYDDSASKFTMIADATDTGSVMSGTAGTLVMTAFEGALTGNVTGNCSGTAATVTTAAQPAITSLGTLTALAVDNLELDGNTIEASTGAINITPAAGSAIVLDGTINIDAGAVTGATSITSTAFVGGLTGNVTGNCSGTAATVTGATQAAITTLAEVTTLGKAMATTTMPGILEVTSGISGNVTGNLTGVVTHSYAAHASAGALAGTNNLYQCTENATLPSSRTVAGHAIMLHVGGASAIEISTEASQKIAGSTSAFDMPAGSSAMFISDGTDWMVF